MVRGVENCPQEAGFGLPEAQKSDHLRGLKSSPGKASGEALG